MRLVFGLLFVAFMMLPFTGGTVFGDNVYTNPKGVITKNKIKIDFMTIKRAAQMYEASEGKLPADIDTLISSGYLDKRSSLDKWGNVYKIEIDGNQVIVMTFGADGKKGGTGKDLDISSKD
ncbi:MAG: type II secretion system protein GspG [Candidatus Anammoxibacter sp.]